MDAKRKLAQTLIPKNVESAIYSLYRNEYMSYAIKVKMIYAWSKALNIMPTVEHIWWDEDMWRTGTDIGDKWTARRNELKPKKAAKIVFDKPTLLQCPKCKKNMVNIDKIMQKRGCDEPATVYASCKNPACKLKLGREHRFRTEG